MFRLHDLHKAVIYHTSTKDVVDARHLFTEHCTQPYCEAQYFCDKKHEGDVTQLIVCDVLNVLLYWDTVSFEQESKLCLSECKFHAQGKCTKGSACTYAHMDDVVQQIALDMRYNYNCSFKWHFGDPKIASQN